MTEFKDTNEELDYWFGRLCISMAGGEKEVRGLIYLMLYGNTREAYDRGFAEGKKVGR